jgi:hypothetical protein
MPSLGDFIITATSKYGAKAETMKMSGPRGNVNVESLVRRSGRSKPKIAVIPDIKPTDVLTPHVLRSLCTQLGIPLSDFGLDLG